MIDVNKKGPDVCHDHADQLVIGGSASYYAQTQTFTQKVANKHLKVIYHPLYGMNNDVLIWGDWLTRDPFRGSHDSQSPHIWDDCAPACGYFRFICHKIIHTL